MPKKYEIQDRWFREAKREGYRARSSFKLVEILKKYKLVLPTSHVMDLGSAPGSWLQVLEKKTGEKGAIIGFDLQEVLPLPKAQTFVCDVFAPEFESMVQQIHPKKFHVITSDMAPRTSGIKDVDQWKSVELNLKVLEIAKKWLKPGGHIITKVFIGEDFNDFWSEAKQMFTKANMFKPLSCRDRSYEQFAVLQGFLY